mgnify:CR=1 FL=1
MQEIKSFLKSSEKYCKTCNISLKRKQNHFCSLKCKGIYQQGKPTWNKGIKGKESHMYGRKHYRKYQTPETRQKISLSMKGIKKSEKHRINISNSKKGHLNPAKREDVKEKIRKFRMTQKIPYVNTSIEIKLYNELIGRNIIFHKHKSILGITQPDAFIEPNICIYADGDYWHNREDIKQKDERINNKLTEGGYIVLRYWEHEINANIESCIDEIEDLIIFKRTTQIYLQCMTIDLTALARSV